MLVCLKQYLEKEVSRYINIEDFQQRQAHILLILDEEIAKLLEEAENEAYTGSTNKKSIFAKNLCQYLQVKN